MKETGHFELGHAADTIMALTRTIAQSTFYPPGHPEARRNLANLAECFDKLWNDPSLPDELHLFRGEAEEEAGWLVSGVAPFPLPLGTLLKTTMGEHLREVFTRFMAAEHVASLAFSVGTSKGTLETFLEVATERLLAMRENQGAMMIYREPELRPSFGMELYNRCGTAVVALTDEEILPARLGKAAWTSRLAVSRIAHYLRTRHTEAADQTGTFRDQNAGFVRMAILRLGPPQFVANTLDMAAELPSVGGHGTILQWIVNAMDEELVVHYAASCAMSALPDDDPRKVTAITAKMSTIQVLCNRAIQLNHPETKGIVDLVIQHNLIPFQEMSPELQDMIRISRWTDQFVDNPTNFLSMIGTIDEREAFSNMVTALRFVYRELRRRKQYDLAVRILGRFLELRDDLEPPFADRAEMLEDTIRRTRSLPLTDALDDLAAAATIEERGPILVLFRLHGATAITPLLTYLAKNRDDDARQDVVRVLAELGSAIIPSVEQELGDTKQPWHYHRDLVRLLAMAGDPSGAFAVRKALHHPHIRVREEAVDALLTLRGESVYPELVAELAKADSTFARHLVKSLASHGCNHPLFRQFVLDELRSAGQGKSADERLTAAAIEASAAVVRNSGEVTEFVAALKSLTDGGFGATLMRFTGRGANTSTVLSQAAAKTIAELETKFG